MQVSIKALAVLAFALATTAAQAEKSAADGLRESPQFTRQEMIERWTPGYLHSAQAYTLESPNYALTRDQGCTRHRLMYPEYNGEVFYAQVRMDTLYYAWAGGDECATAPREDFFYIEDGTSEFFALDFLRALESGIVGDRDKVSAADRPRIDACFADGERAQTGIVKAWSVPVEDDDEVRDRYGAFLHCAALDATGEWMLSWRREGEERIEWSIVGKPID